MSCNCRRATQTPYDSTQCYMCWLMLNRPEYAKLFGRPEPMHALPLPTSITAKPSASFPCDYRGRVVGKVKCLESCERPLLVLECSKHGQCTYLKQGEGIAAVCSRCIEREERVEQYAERAGDPSVAVVIGAYKWPSIVELQLRLIQETCGKHIRVIVSDDMPGSFESRRSKTLEDICLKYDATYSPNARHLGHGGGDLIAYTKASLIGADVVAKLSQRLCVLRGRWLQDAAIALLKSGRSTSIQRCSHVTFKLRTEICLLRPDRWTKPLPLQCGDKYAEGVIEDYIGDDFLPLDLLGPRREIAYPKVLWHNSHSLSDYLQVARQLGVTLEDDFHVDGWEAEQGRGEYRIG